MTGLNRDNFRLYEGGKALPSDSKRRKHRSQLPFLSSIVSRLYLEEIEAAVLGFLEYASKYNLYAFATFDGELKVHADFTKQIGRVRKRFFLSCRFQ